MAWSSDQQAGHSAVADGCRDHHGCRAFLRAVGDGATSVGTSVALHVAAILPHLDHAPEIIGPFLYRAYPGDRTPFDTNRFDGTWAIPEGNGHGAAIDLTGAGSPSAEAQIVLAALAVTEGTLRKAKRYGTPQRGSVSGPRCVSNS